MYQLESAIYLLCMYILSVHMRIYMCNLAILCITSLNIIGSSVG